jgi:hypothetical protein
MARRRRRAVRGRKRSTRKGQRRITARRAYTGLRRRRRSNPKGIFQTPAARYAGWAAGGAATEVIVAQTPFLQNQVPNRLARAAIFAAITLFIGRTMKGRVRENSTAYAIGMMIPAIADQVGSLNLGSALRLGNGNGNGNGAIGTQSAALIRSNPGHAYSAANAQVAKVNYGGLRAL